MQSILRLTRLTKVSCSSRAKRAKPKIISYALGNSKEHIREAHDAGILFMQQVHTPKQARQAAELVVDDALIAQRIELDGFARM